MPKANSLLPLRAAGDVFEDPGILVSPANFPFSLLFDAGTLHGLKVRNLQRVKWLFFSHFHIDHVIGFDHLLRVRLFSDVPLTVFGPPGTTRIIGNRLQGYAWNLTSGSPFILRTVEFEGDLEIRVTEFACHDSFEPQMIDTPKSLNLIAARTISIAKHLTIQWHPVNHGVPCMAYRLDHSSPPKFSHREATRLGLKPGPWIRILVESEQVVNQKVNGVLRDRAWLSQRLLESVSPQSLGYLTDTMLDEPLASELQAFFAGVTTLCSESAYLDSEADLARANLHMHCSQVANLAKRCGAAHLKIFHLSRRHIENGPEPHLSEVRRIFPEAELLSPEK